jgi:hypothetical protein
VGTVRLIFVSEEAKTGQSKQKLKRDRFLQKLKDENGDIT